MLLQLTAKESDIVFLALEELYDNLQYNELENDQLRNQQQIISTIIGKLLRKENEIL